MNARVLKPVASMIALLLAGLLATGCASTSLADVADPDAPRSLPEQGPVSVQWTDPAQFSEIRYSGNRWEAQRGDWVRRIAEHLRDQAADRIAPGSRLDVTITDIDRAGDYEPWRGIGTDSVRFMRDIYPPRIDLTFRLTDADGSVVAQGARELVDLGYLMDISRYGDNDALRYEQQLIDDWLRQEFGAPGA